MFCYDEAQNAFSVSNPVAHPPQTIMEKCNTSINLIQKLVKTEGNGVLQVAWTVFTKELTADLLSVEERVRVLERIIKVKNEQLEENVLTFDEQQQLFEQEKKQIIEKERDRGRKQASELRSKLVQTEIQLNEAMEIKNDMVNKFNELFRKRKNYKSKKDALVREIEDLTHEVELQKDVISKLKKALNDTQDQLEKDTKRVFNEGFELGRKLATTEEIRVFEELRMLQEIQETLEMDMRRI